MGLFKTKEEKFLADVRKIYFMLMDDQWAQVPVREHMQDESPRCVEGAVIQVLFNRGDRNAAYTAQVPPSYFEYFWQLARKRYRL